MFAKFVCLSACLLLVLAAATPVHKRFAFDARKTDLIEVIELEQGCVYQGGMCVKSEDCPAGNLVSMHLADHDVTLCPRQQHLGVVCCYN